MAPKTIVEMSAPLEIDVGQLGVRPGGTMAPKTIVEMSVPLEIDVGQLGLPGFAGAARVRACGYCGKGFALRSPSSPSGKRADARYCSGACRKRAYMKRKRERAALPPLPKPSTDRAVRRGLEKLRRVGEKAARPTRWLQLFDQFVAFLERNPGFWPLFERYAYRAERAGRERFSSMLVMQRVRWDHETGDDRNRWGLKLNNNFTSYCSRLFEILHPESEGLFEKRTQHTLKRPPKVAENLHVSRDYDEAPE